MSNVGERPRMHKHALSFERLKQRRMNGILHQNSRCSCDAESFCRHRRTIASIRHYDPPDTRTQILQIIGQRQARH